MRDNCNAFLNYDQFGVYKEQIKPKSLLFQEILSIKVSKSLYDLWKSVCKKHQGKHVWIEIFAYIGCTPLSWPVLRIMFSGHKVGSKTVNTSTLPWSQSSQNIALLTLPYHFLPTQRTELILLYISSSKFHSITLWILCLELCNSNVQTYFFGISWSITSQSSRTNQMIDNERNIIHSYWAMNSCLKQLARQIYDPRWHVL